MQNGNQLSRVKFKHHPCTLKHANARSCNSNLTCVPLGEVRYFLVLDFNSLRSIESSAQEKSETISDTQTQRSTKTTHQEVDMRTIRNWSTHCKDTEVFCGASSGVWWKRRNHREVFARSPHTSIGGAERELEVPQSRIHSVTRPFTHKLVTNCKCYRPDNRITNWMKTTKFPREIMFSDKDTLHVQGKVSKQAVRTWGSEYNSDTAEHISNWLLRPMSPPFDETSFFAEATVTLRIYIDICWKTSSTGTAEGRVLPARWSISYPCNRPWDIEGPTFTRQSAINIVSPTQRPQFNPGRFLVLISVGGWVDPRAIVRLEGLRKLKKQTIT
jgi:hypothetical protein